MIGAALEFVLWLLCEFLIDIIVIGTGEYVIFLVTFGKYRPFKEGSSSAMPLIAGICVWVGIIVLLQQTIWG